ncbi:potassium voltage-gated channel subfamily KQT [Streptomyces laurentii]|uniref:Potassium voltage-gated channel subfamily KQT n=1 Tax=Streptomyces laurentii TaxID=39478 RepID=A0A160NTZ1_STRLU|nr:potassium voltage-gated channel subfamily KQT [Streptomyces laurentii]
MEIPLAVASVVFLGGYSVRVLAHGHLHQGWLDLSLALTLAA